MKIVIIHNSIHGNGIIVAKTLADQFDKRDEITILHNNEVVPEDLVKMNVDLLIIGTAVRKFVLVWESQRWIKSLHNELQKSNNTIPFIVGFVTHMRNEEKINKKFTGYKKLLQSIEGVDYVYPELLTAQVEKIEGPLLPNVIPYLQKHGRKIYEWSTQGKTKSIVDTQL